jgi:hypothetical protein
VPVPEHSARGLRRAPRRPDKTLFVASSIRQTRVRGLDEGREIVITYARLAPARRLDVDRPAAPDGDQCANVVAAAAEGGSSLRDRQQLHGGTLRCPASGVDSHEYQLEILMRPATVQVLVPHADQWWPVPAPLAADPKAADPSCSRLT